MLRVVKNFANSLKIVENSSSPYLLPLHHLYADVTQLFLSFHPSEFYSNITHLQNALQQISSWMTANLLTLNSSKTEFLLIGLKEQFSKIHDSFVTTTTLLATLALSLMNTLHSPTKHPHFLNPATITFVNFAVSAHINQINQIVHLYGAY